MQSKTCSCQYFTCYLRPDLLNALVEDLQFETQKPILAGSLNQVYLILTEALPSPNKLSTFNDL